jgi:hypothetical protein
MRVVAGDSPASTRGIRTQPSANYPNYDEKEHCTVKLYKIEKEMDLSTSLRSAYSTQHDNRSSPIDVVMIDRYIIK